MDSENAKEPLSGLQSQEKPQKDTIHSEHSAPRSPEHSANEAPSAPPPTRSLQSTQPGQPDPSKRTKPSKTSATPSKTTATPSKTSATPSKTSATPSKTSATPSKTSATPAEHQGPAEHHGPTEHQMHLSKSETEAIQKRAAGRARVPPQFRDSFKRFFFSPTGASKVVRLGLLIGALTCFIVSEAHESYIAITLAEAFIVLFFIVTYMLTLHRLMTYLHWPLLSAEQQEADKAKSEQL